jgi:hypothetical protein
VGTRQAIVAITLGTLATGCGGGGGGGGGGGSNPQAGPKNVLPTAEAILIETPKDAALVLTLRGTDPEGQDLSFGVVTPPTIGSLSVIAPIAGTPIDSALVTYTPDPGRTGADQFTFVAYDGQANSKVSRVRIGVGVHLIVGSVTRFDGQPYFGMPLEFVGAGASAGDDFRQVTDAQGEYLIPLPTTWTGNIDTTNDYRLVPPSRAVSSGTNPMAGQDFVGSRNYYVDINDPNATGTGDGREATPFPDLDVVQTLVDPGDTVWIHGGTYVSLRNRMVELNRGGRPGAPVTWAAVSGEKVILDVNANQDCFHVVLVTDVVIRGFEVKNARRDAFRIQGSADCVFENNIVHDSKSSTETAGIRLRESCERMTIRGNEIYACSRGIVSGPPHGNRVGIVIEGNYVHDLEQGLATETGISMVASEGSVHNNVVARCEGAGIQADASDVLVEGNVVFNCGALLPANGFVFINGSNVVARRNVSFNNAGHGFFGLGANAQNNVAFGNGLAGVWVTAAQTLRNNIAFQNNQSGGFSDIGGPGAVDSDANFWADGVFPVGEGPSSLAGDPGFLLPPVAGAALDVNNPGFVIDPSAGGFGDVSALFGLTAGSPAVDAGVDVGLPFNGAAPDMGAFERG